MDDNLSIHIDEYIKNPLINEKYKFNKEEILNVIQQSSIVYYDTTSGYLKLKYKPKRRIIVFRDVPKNKQNQEDIRKLFTIDNDIFIPEITEIKTTYEMFYVYFSGEEETIKAFRLIEKIRESDNKVKDWFIKPFEFTAFVKVENLKKDLIGIENNDDSPNKSKVIPNVPHYQPRKISLTEYDSNYRNSYHNYDYNLQNISKFDKYDPFYGTTNKDYFIRKQSYNKYDTIVESKFKRNKANSFFYEKPYLFKKERKQIPLNKNFQNFSNIIYII